MNARAPLGFFVFVAVSIFCLSGCLQTRSAIKDQEEKQVLQKTVKNLQTSTADVNTRFMEIDEDMRKLNGRVETVEFKLSQAQQKTDAGSKTTDQKLVEVTEKLKIYQDAITKLDMETAELRAALSQMQEEMRKSPPASSASRRSAGGIAAAEELFKAQDWKEAILEYEKYRKASPKGKMFAEATYKIGVCFQELGLTDEAKAFYEEVLAKFPKTKEADRASYRLKNLTKKK